ncbi:MAG TPA: hypothetical protein VJT15_17255 [Pyrinomonadaceae bacterium]|nr:hypothetical protein [Pyrinomonadaceae bacterium]
MRQNTFGFLSLLQSYIVISKQDQGLRFARPWLPSAAPAADVPAYV